MSMEYSSALNIAVERHREMLAAAESARQVAAARRGGRAGRFGRRGPRRRGAAEPSSNHGADLLTDVHR